MSTKKKTIKLTSGEKLEVAGQEVERTEDYYLWVLEKGIYVTAGKKYWPEELNSGEPCPGISINMELFVRVMDERRRLIIHDKQEGCYRLLNSETKAWMMSGVLEKYGLPLLVVPISCFETVAVVR